MFKKVIVKGTDIKYISTNLNARPVLFREALLRGLAPDGGLYLPSSVPLLNSDEMESLMGMEYPELASKIVGKFTGDDISSGELESICREVYSFSLPVEHVKGSSYILRLDRGPTASFKDFAALLMGRLMQHFLSRENRNIIILTATSGDTGSAVANAFAGLGNIRVIILYPAGEVSDLQRKQMTTFDDNISVIEIGGKFDDCQKLVKKAFMDESLSVYNLSSANSINIGRLLPQSVYYFKAWAELAKGIADKIVFSVPCGNFGNVAGGLIAARMGLPVRKFVIATNENNEVPEFLSVGKYEPIAPSKNCISSAMNVGHPSNLARIVSMYGGIMDEHGRITKAPDLNRMRKELFAISVSDEMTRASMKQFYHDYGKLLEPHGAVAWHGLSEYLKTIENTENEGIINVSLETAHPAKFREEIRSLLNVDPVTPDSLKTIEFKKEEYISLENNYHLLKDYITKNY
ncbi:MAG: threonine synthase [Bacteroidales bacterium]|jgi:threonine synthase|nr:threonine synthase [Bacteroidales bacterium]